MPHAPITPATSVTQITTPRDPEHADCTSATMPRRQLVLGIAQTGVAAAWLRTGVVLTAGTGVLAYAGPAAADTETDAEADAEARADAGMRNPARRHGPEVLSDWIRTLYSGLMDEPTMTPGRAARIYATCMVAAYEAVVPGTNHLRTLSGQLNDLDRVEPRRDIVGLDWPTVVTTAVAATASSLLRNASPSLLAAVAAQRDTHLDQRRTAGIAANVINRSDTRGRRVGGWIAAWAADDGAEATYGRPYTPPVGPSLWRSTAPNFGTAIDPYWGEVRTMALPAADTCAPKAPIRFRTNAGSAFHNQALAVIAAADGLNDAGKLTSLFWRDNPTTSGLPSGHWMRLVAQLSSDRGLTLPAAARALTMTGITLHDAFISCWHQKYTVNLLRPITYIREHVAGYESWSSYVNTPQFPEYTSGHSVASQAAATVLTQTMGTFTFTDRTHGLRNSHLGERTYNSFQTAAEEAAQSRLLGGIHYPMGIDEGLVQGARVGRTVLRRVRMTRQTTSSASS